MKIGTFVGVVAAWALTIIGHAASLLREEWSTLAIALAAVVTIVWTQAERVQGHAQDTGAGLAQVRAEVQELRGEVRHLGEQMQTDIYGLGIHHDRAAQGRGNGWAATGSDDARATGPFKIVPKPAD